MTWSYIHLYTKPWESLSWNRPKIAMYPKSGYMSNVPKIWIHCRDGPCLSETGAMFVGKSAFDGTFFGTIAVENQHSCEIHRLVGYLSRDKPWRSVTNRDKPWPVDQKLYLNWRHCPKIAWRTMTRRDGLCWNMCSRNEVVNNVSR